jgi:hypothetical protein
MSEKKTEDHKDDKTADRRMQLLLRQLKLLEQEKQKLYAEFEKRKRQREAHQRALEAERTRTEKRLGRLERILDVLNKAVERIRLIVERLKRIQKQQEYLANQILRRIEGIEGIKGMGKHPDERRTVVPRIHAPVAEKRPILHPALPGLPPAIAEHPLKAEVADLSPDAAREAREALFGILQEIQSFRKKREEIEKEVDRLKSL